MELKDYLIMFVVIGLVVTAFTMMIGGYNNKYGQNVNSTEFEATFGKINEISNLTENVSKLSFQDATLDEGVGLVTASKKVWAAAKLLTATPGMMLVMLTDLLAVFGLTWVAGSLYLMMFILLTITLIYFVWRYKI